MSLLLQTFKNRLIKVRGGRFLLAAAALFLVLAFFVAPLHHHEHASETLDCSVCHWVQHVPFLFFLALVLILKSESRLAFTGFCRRLFPVTLAFQNHSRAPPFFAFSR